MYSIVDRLDIDKLLKIKRSLSNRFAYFNSEDGIRVFVESRNRLIHTIFSGIYDNKSCSVIPEEAKSLIDEHIGKEYGKIRKQLEGYFFKLKEKTFINVKSNSDDEIEKALVGGAVGAGAALAIGAAFPPVLIFAAIGSLVGFTFGSGSKKKAIINAISNYQRDEANKIETLILDTIESKILDYYKTLMQNFSYSDIINNPDSIKDIDVNFYKDIAEKIDEFDPKNEELIKFAKEVHLIADNESNLKKQKTLHEQYLKNLLTKDMFYDFNDRYKFIKSMETIADEIKNHDVKFFDFYYVDKPEKYINDKNEDFLARHYKDKFFDGKNSFLDPDQRDAILQDEISSLIIAGAGCGKTTTSIAKLDYLINIKKVNPKRILLLSFGRDVSKKLKHDAASVSKDVKACTFHKLGLEILEEASETKLVADNQYKAIIHNFFRQEVFNSKNKNVRDNLIRYFSFYINPIDYDKVYQNKNEIYGTLNKQDLQTLKSYSKSKNLTTLNKETVKSYEELAIANFYFLNGINYEYEKQYEYKTSDKYHKQYQPDFYLTDYDIWHEHYGVNEKLQAWQYPPEVAKKYLETIKWKRKVHLENKTKCIETYSYWFKNNTLESELTKILKSNGVKFKKRSTQEIIDSLHSVCSGSSYESFIALVSTFVALYKSKYNNEKQFDEFKKMNYPNLFTKNRCNIFLDICKEFYLYYRKTIKGKIDFDDMIIESTKKLSSSKFKNKYKYDYILVDEFQDISFSRMELLKELIRHGNSKLFAVGDDWQSIFRFAGSDLDIFVNFKKYFGEYARFCYITSTHRNSQKLQDIAGPFIKRNPEQLDKRIISHDSNLQVNNPIQIIYCHDDKKEQLRQLLRKIKSRNEKASVLILGRNNHDIDPVCDEDLYIPRDISKKDKKSNDRLKSTEFENMDIKFSTVHSAKGLEDQYVIIINAENSTLGFPNKVEDDYVLNLVLSKQSNFLYAEERRLWYVALTRTKGYVFILTEARNPSDFVKEIEKECYVLNKDAEEKTYICPECGGALEKRIGKKGKVFMKCKNFPYCDYVITENDFDKVVFDETCPECHDFLMRKRRKKDGSEFFGCHSFPVCKYTKNKSTKARISLPEQKEHDIIDDDLPF